MFTTLLFTILIGFGSDHMISSDITDKTIDTAASTITWKGKKVTGAHEGTLQLKSGTLSFDGDMLSGGTFEIDMTSIATTDLSGNMAGKLDGHLKSDDFFGVAKFPTSTLVITKVTAADEGYAVTADLTIKGITHPVSFNVTTTDSAASAAITVDRTLYDVKYNSGKFFDSLGDKMIYDNFDLEVNLAY